ncbi:MAG: hypothetical protein ACYCX2_12150 [Christensenellales bacterium]
MTAVFRQAGFGGGKARIMAHASKQGRLLRYAASPKNIFERDDTQQAGNFLSPAAPEAPMFPRA